MVVAGRLLSMNELTFSYPPILTWVDRAKKVSVLKSAASHIHKLAVISLSQVRVEHH